EEQLARPQVPLPLRHAADRERELEPLLIPAQAVLGPTTLFHGDREEKKWNRDQRGVCLKRKNVFCRRTGRVRPAAVDQGPDLDEGDGEDGEARLPRPESKGRPHEDGQRGIDLEEYGARRHRARIESEADQQGGGRQRGGLGQSAPERTAYPFDSALERHHD